MANTARQVKRRISTARNISKITKAMEMVAASKMKKAQEQAISAKPFAIHLLNSLNAIARKTDPSLHPLLSQHESGIHVALVIATDRGLCGSLNTHLLKKLNELRQTHGELFGVVAVGKKAVLFCRAFGFKILAQFTDLPEKIKPGDVVSVSQVLIEKFLNHEYRSVRLVYMDFVNTLKQVPRSEQLLPISKTAVSMPTTQSWDLKNESKPEEDKILGPAEYVFEPSAAKILNDLLPFYIEVVLYHAFLEARASEHSARMVAMKNASQNASDLVQELLLIFNKSRQQNITNELLDITTASLTLT